MKIITTPHPTLKKKTPILTTWTDKLQQQADEMVHILRHTSDPEGIGLAAPQVNLSKRFFILLLDGTPTIYINPTVTKSSTKMLSENTRNLKNASSKVVSPFPSSGVLSTDLLKLLSSTKHPKK